MISGRVVAVCARAAPEGSLEAALLEDVVDLVDGMQQVSGALLAAAGAGDDARRVAWFGMPVIDLADASMTAGAALAAVGNAGADEVSLVCPDAPDLPPLLVGKLFSALTSYDVAVCPADDGRLVALASRLPAPQWLVETGVGLDDSDSLERLRRAAPRRGLQVGSGWHRVRGIDDARALDPGLEGWEATRTWVAQH